MPERYRSICAVAVAACLIHLSQAARAQTEETASLRSDRMEIINRGESASFIGNARFTQGRRTIKAARMTRNEKTGTLIAQGQVEYSDYLEEFGSVRAHARRIDYSENESHGVMTGNPRLTRIDEQNPEKNVTIYGNTIHIYPDRKTATVIGHAHIETADIAANGNELDFDYADKSAVLSGGRPLVIYTGSAADSMYKADKIYFYIDEEIVIMDGAVEGTISNVRAAEGG